MVFVQNRSVRSEKVGFTNGSAELMDFSKQIICFVLYFDVNAKQEQTYGYKVQMCTRCPEVMRHLISVIMDCIVNTGMALEYRKEHVKNKNLKKKKNQGPEEMHNSL